MYIPNMFRDEDRVRLVEFMRCNPFAALVSSDQGTPVATHLPLTLRESEDALLLHGHFAKANPQWQSVVGAQVLAIFTGPHAYISPSHYDRLESVPTWNYLAVHAYGRARLLESDEDKEGLLYDLVAQHEAAYQEQWDGLPERYRKGMLRGIVGFELTVTRLEGKAKLSQNKSVAERTRIAASLVSSTDTVVRQTGEEMKRRRLTSGEEQ